MAQPNYQFEKKQRELKKSRKQEEKRLKKLKDKQGDVTDAPAAQSDNLQEQAQ